MIDLRNTCILVRTKEENERLLKEAEKQGFHWCKEDHCEPLPGQHFPDILKFYNDKDVVYSARIGAEINAFYETSEILGTKEMTAREFIECFVNIRSCRERRCSKCVLDSNNTKCNKILCDPLNWKNSIDELLEIVASGRTTVLLPEKKAIENIEKLIQEKDYIKITDEIKDSLKLAIEKLKEGEADE